MMKIRVASIFFFLLTPDLSSAQNTCIPKNFPDLLSNDPGIVCVCNATYCDDFPEIGSLNDFEAVIITSSMAGKRFHKETAAFQPISGKKKRSIVLLDDIESLLDDLLSIDEDTNVGIVIDPSVQYQKIIGFGGAFTDSAGVNLNKSSEGVRKNILNAYFGPNGKLRSV